MRELVVLGTASQVPTRYRNHNGYVLRWDDEVVLFDPGEGTQRQMLLAGVPSSAATVAGPRPSRWVSTAPGGKIARSCARGSAASMASPDAVRVAGNRTPTSVTRDGRPAARSSIR